MADALVSGLVKELLGRLTTAAIQEYRLLRRLKNDLLTLEDKYNQIQAVLEDAEEKQTREKAVELWLKRLRSESLKMENLLDDVLAEAMLRQLHKELSLGMKYRVRTFFSSNHNPLMFHYRIAHKVKAIRRKLAVISAERSELNLSPGDVTSPVDGGIGGGIPSRETSSLIHSSTVFGRNEELKMVIEKICKTDIGKKEDTDILVYAIWGMGGLGKTTLAQLVYNDERVKEHFDPKCWIYVSEKFQVKKLLKGISESDSEDSELSLDALQKRVQDKLRGKRFLVVLDDVWIENNETDRWEDLSKTLSCGEEGSIVVMTTRSKTTSRMMAKFPELQHELGCLSQEDSWLLFKKFAFAEGREGEDITELEPIGKTIVEKCKGLPLAVKTLGGLMWSKSSTSDWQRVMRSDIWELQEKELQEIYILPALKLSYDNLHPHVKRCFAYCCMLLLNGCQFLYKLPEGMGYMKNLQYLDASYSNLQLFPVGIGKLTSLRRLTSFVIGRNEGAQIEELGYLNLLGPDLKLKGLGNVKGLMEARSANLKSKTNLFDLKLIWSPFFGFRGHDEEVLEGLEPNPRLKELTIDGYCGKNISPSWMFNLRNLVQIEFSYCNHSEHILPLGKLPSLRVIRLELMSSLKCFYDDDMSGDNVLFPQLQELKISYCRELINLPNNFPKLKELTLENCPKLVSLPEEIQSFKDLSTLNITRCENLSRRYANDIGADWPTISHILNINIDAPR